MNITVVGNLRKIFTKYIFIDENGKLCVKFQDFSRVYDENLSLDIHSVIEKYEKFAFITTKDNSLLFNFPTFSITTNLVDYSIDFDYSKGDVKTFDFIDFITKYEKLFNETQELRDRFNNYDICITIDLHLMVKFRNMTSFKIIINQQIHDNIFNIIQYLANNCLSYTNTNVLIYEFTKCKIIIEFDKIIIYNPKVEDKIVYSLDELKTYIEHEEETNFSKLLKKDTTKCYKQCKNNTINSHIFLRIFTHFIIILIFVYIFEYLAI